MSFSLITTHFVQECSVTMYRVTGTNHRLRQGEEPALFSNLCESSENRGKINRLVSKEQLSTDRIEASVVELRQTKLCWLKGIDS